MQTISLDYKSILFCESIVKIVTHIWKYSLTDILYTV